MVRGAVRKRDAICTGKHPAVATSRTRLRNIRRKPTARLSLSGLTEDVRNEWRLSVRFDFERQPAELTVNAVTPYVGELECGCFAQPFSQTATQVCSCEFAIILTD